MATHAMDEAKRCLQCKVPRCRGGCPISTAIPEMMRDFLNGDIDAAGKRLFENNPLSLICSLVCDHESQCEGNCILNRKGTPIHVSSVENYISDSCLDKLNLQPADKKNQKAAIIGAGPAGMTISILLALKGYGVTLFDSRDKIGGVLRYGIPDFRLPKSILDRYHKLMVSLGIRIRPNTTIGGALKLDDLFRDGYSAVFIGTGVWRPKTLGIKGESLGNVHYAVDYLCNPASYQLGQRVAVIGAGNSAMDAARTALRHGASQVTVYVRKDKVAASRREVDYAKIDGVEFEFCKVATELTEEGPIFKTVQYDEEGRVIDLPGSEKLYPADSTIIAISQGPKDKIVSTTKGIEVSHHGLVVTDEQGATTRPGVFAAGDVVLGARTVVEAVAYSKKVAEAMDDYMSSLPK